MNEIPMEWIDKIFDLLGIYFGERWTEGFKYPQQIDMYKSIWKNGLQGLSREEIKKGLSLAKQMAKNNQPPPHVIEFFHYSKGTRVPPNPPKATNFKPNKHIAANSIGNMKLRLSGIRDYR